MARTTAIFLSLIGFCFPCVRDLGAVAEEEGEDVILPVPPRGPQPFVRGDTNFDGPVGLSDAVEILGYLFLGQRGPLDCLDAADTDDDGRVGLTDVVYLLNHLFGGSPRLLPQPGRLCGFDRTPDLLFCAESSCSYPPEEFTNSVSMRFLYLPPGSFIMGSPPGERGRVSNEGPQHTVHLTCGFYISVHEVTQAAYLGVMGENPSGWVGDRLDRPVENVTWFDAAEFCDRLTQMEGRLYRLPTEAEWEYACRAGTATRFSFGDALECDDTGPTYCETFAKYIVTHGSRTSEDKYPPSSPLPVGQRPPNPWGLHDMHGNVMEWCLDWFGGYRPGDQVDPAGPPEGTKRIIRGAGDLYPVKGRSASRVYYWPDGRGGNHGFRIVQPLCSGLGPAGPAGPDDHHTSTP